MSRVRSVDIEDEFSRIRLGSAKVYIRDLDIKDVRPVDISGLESCMRADPKRRVPIVVPRHHVTELLRHNSIVLGDLVGSITPFLKPRPGRKLKLLLPRHRVLAAERSLSVPDQCWEVDIYEEETISVGIYERLQIICDNELPYGDGLIYCQIRKYQKARDRAQACRWLATLSPSKRRDIKQLQRSRSMRQLRQAFDLLLDMTGMWYKFQIGIFHRLLTMRCTEELAYRVRGTFLAWKNIIGDQADPMLVDVVTVNLLQGRSPYYSDVDKMFILRNRELLFSLATDQHWRGQAIDRVLATKTMIPSLYTFLEDSKWLEPSSKILRDLLPDSFRGTIRQGLRKCFPPEVDNKIFMQTSEGRSIMWPCSEKTAFPSAYRQLWLFAMRHFPYMGAVKPRKNDRRSIPLPSKNRVECWHQFVELASDLGFSSTWFSGYLEDKRDEVVAKSILSRVRPAQFYKFPEQQLAVQSLKLSKVLEAINPLVPRISKPELTSDTDTGQWSLNFRCGRVYERAFVTDQKYMFLPNFYNVDDRIICRQNVTSFYVFRDTFRSLLGHSLEMEDDSDSEDVDEFYHDVELPYVSKTGSESITGAKNAERRTEQDEQGFSFNVTSQPPDVSSTRPHPVDISFTQPHPADVSYTQSQPSHASVIFHSSPVGNLDVSGLTRLWKKRRSRGIRKSQQVEKLKLNLNFPSQTWMPNAEVLPNLPPRENEPQLPATMEIDHDGNGSAAEGSELLNGQEKATEIPVATAENHDNSTSTEANDVALTSTMSAEINNTDESMTSPEKNELTNSSEPQEDSLMKNNEDHSLQITADTTHSTSETLATPQKESRPSEDNGSQHPVADLAETNALGVNSSETNNANFSTEGWERQEQQFNDQERLFNEDSEDEDQEILSNTKLTPEDDAPQTSEDVAQARIDPATEEPFIPPPTQEISSEHASHSISQDSLSQEEVQNNTKPRLTTPPETNAAPPPAPPPAPTGNSPATNAKRRLNPTGLNLIKQYPEQIVMECNKIPRRSLLQICDQMLRDESTGLSGCIILLQPERSQTCHFYNVNKSSIRYNVETIKYYKKKGDYISRVDLSRDVYPPLKEDQLEVDVWKKGVTIIWKNVNYQRCIEPDTNTDRQEIYFPTWNNTSKAWNRDGYVATLPIGNKKKR